jgi:hypothetical protein
MDHPRWSEAIEKRGVCWLRRVPRASRHSAWAGAASEKASRQPEAEMIRKLKSGEYRLYSRKKDPRSGKRRNLGTFPSREKAEAHERAVQFFKHQH